MSKRKRQESKEDLKPKKQKCSGNCLTVFITNPSLQFKNHSCPEEKPVRECIVKEILLIISNGGSVGDWWSCVHLMLRCVAKLDEKVDSVFKKISAACLLHENSTVRLWGDYLQVMRTSSLLTNPLARSDLLQFTTNKIWIPRLTTEAAKNEGAEIRISHVTNNLKKSLKPKLFTQHLAALCAVFEENQCPITQEYLVTDVYLNQVFHKDIKNPRPWKLAKEHLIVRLRCNLFPIDALVELTFYRNCAQMHEISCRSISDWKSDKLHQSSNLHCSTAFSVWKHQYYLAKGVLHCILKSALPIELVHLVTSYALSDVQVEETKDDIARKQKIYQLSYDDLISLLRDHYDHITEIRDKNYQNRVPAISYRQISSSGNSCSLCHEYYGNPMCSFCREFIKWLPQQSVQEKEKTFMSLLACEAIKLNFVPPIWVRKYIKHNLLSLNMSYSRLHYCDPIERKLLSAKHVPLLLTLCDASHDELYRFLIAERLLLTAEVVDRLCKLLFANDKLFKCDNDMIGRRQYDWLRTMGQFLLDPWNVDLPFVNNTARSAFACNFQQTGDLYKVGPNTFQELFNLWEANRL